MDMSLQLIDTPQGLRYASGMQAIFIVVAPIVALTYFGQGLAWLWGAGYWYVVVAVPFVTLLLGYWSDTPLERAQLRSDLSACVPHWITSLWSQR